jgi:5-methylcytosine-specific restriction endonuclease McrA
MLRITERSLAASARVILDDLQALIDAEPDYPAKVRAAKKAWDSKTSTKAKADTFQIIRQTLSLMCVGTVRCAYCEDSLADEVEHIRPKNFFPQFVFKWGNYLFACGPCNSPKGNRYGVLTHDTVEEFIRAPRGPVTPPPTGPAALIDPRTEDPLDFFELDLGGTTPDGVEVPGTFEFFPNDAADPGAQARAKFSIEVLGLNREVMRVARENAFGGFRARLREYVEERQNGASSRRLEGLRDDLLSTPHLTVFAEMRRQQDYLPEIRALFDHAPEAKRWPLIASGS